MRGLLFALLSSCALAGCLRADAAQDAPAAPPPAPSATSEASPPAAVSTEPALDDAPMPGPRRGRLAAAVARNVACASCHEEEAAAWRRSRHRQASTNAAYRAAIAIEPSPFCRGCHAPEGDPSKPPPHAVDDLGVGCVTCHVTEEGVVLAAPSCGDDAEAAPHPVRRSAAFAGTGGCAGCHEFSFPGARDDDDGSFMQTTAREHRRSPGVTKACAACHMPLVEGRRSHAFDAVRDPGWLREHLSATAERAGEDGVRVTLAQTDPAHGFPTGDLFRRLEVGCEARGADGSVIERRVRHLARHFEKVPGYARRALVGDDRVFDAPVVVEAAFPGTRPAAVRWWVKLQRVATVGTGTDPADAKIESEVELHSGVLPWESR